MKLLDFGAMCAQRLLLIDALEEGRLTKEAFILENYEMLKYCHHIGFNVKSVNEGIIKYHYFNTMAKKMMLDADEIEFRAPEKSIALKEEAYRFYLKKDRITLQLLEFVSFQNVNAYFIHMKSKRLEGEIFEIDFYACDRVILHSKDKKILHKLKTAGCFQDGKVESKVQTYVDTKI